MCPTHFGHRDLDRGHHLLRRRRRPLRPVCQPGQVVRQVPPDPNGAPSTDAPRPARPPRSPPRPPTPRGPRPNHCSTTDNTTSANPASRRSGRPTETSTPRCRTRATVAHHLADDCRASPVGAQPVEPVHCRIKPCQMNGTARPGRRARCARGDSRRCRSARSA